MAKPVNRIQLRLKAKIGQECEQETRNCGAAGKPAQPKVAITAFSTF